MARDVAVRTEITQCIAAFFSDMFAAAPVVGNYHYRYNLLDSTPGGQNDLGLFTEHTSELYAIWGLNNTDGGDPACFKLPASDPLSCVTGGKITQAYWISFIRTLNPNTFRLAGSPEWTEWSIAEPNRIVLDTAQAEMEVMGARKDEVVVAGLNHRQRCQSLVLPLAKTINAGTPAGGALPPFANGTRVDPTLGVGLVGNSSAGATKRTAQLNSPRALAGPFEGDAPPGE